MVPRPGPHPARRRRAAPGGDRRRRHPQRPARPARVTAATQAIERTASAPRQTATSAMTPRVAMSPAPARACSPITAVRAMRGGAPHAGGCRGAGREPVLPVPDPGADPDRTARSVERRTGRARRGTSSAARQRGAHRRARGSCRLGCHPGGSPSRCERRSYPQHGHGPRPMASTAAWSTLRAMPRSRGVSDEPCRVSDRVGDRAARVRGDHRQQGAAPAAARPAARLDRIPERLRRDGRRRPRPEEVPVRRAARGDHARADLLGLRRPDAPGGHAVRPGVRRGLEHPGLRAATSCWARRSSSRATCSRRS